MNDDFSPLLKEEVIPLEDRESQSFTHNAIERLIQNKVALASICFLFLLLALSVFGPYFSSYTYYENHLAQRNSPPSREFFFGSDDLGRDLFTRVCYGGRVSLFVACTAALIDLLVGVLWGSIAAFSRRSVDEAMMRFADVLYAIPNLLLIILLIVVLGPGLLSIILALTITGWINMARIVRGQILRLKEEEFVMAAQALGAGFFRILFTHLIPNAIGPIIVTVTLTIPTAIFIESFLSFLGLGIQAPVASWGSMARDGLSAMRFYPWRIFIPATFISFTMLAFNLLGDALRDAFDPLSRRQS